MLSQGIIFTHQHKEKLTSAQAKTAHRIHPKIRSLPKGFWEVPAKSFSYKGNTPFQRHAVWVGNWRPSAGLALIHCPVHHHLLERDFPVVFSCQLHKDTGQFALDFLEPGRRRTADVNLDLVVD